MLLDKWIKMLLAIVLEFSGMNAFADANGIAGEVDAWRFVEAFNAAFAANSPDAYFKYIDKDVTVITPANPYRVEGVHDDREEFERSLRRNLSRVSLWQAMQPKIQLYGDMVVVSFFVRGKLGPPEQPQTVYWKITDVLTKKDENWKVVHIHVSATQ